MALGRVTDEWCNGVMCIRNSHRLLVPPHGNDAACIIHRYGRVVITRFTSAPFNGKPCTLSIGDNMQRDNVRYTDGVVRTR
jgi:hypothetical protein